VNRRPFRDDELLEESLDLAMKYRYIMYPKTATIAIEGNDMVASSSVEDIFNATTRFPTAIDR
jgi:hypothetical protein